MSLANFSTFEVLNAALKDGAFLNGGSDTNPAVAPETILTFLARLRLLEGVPFNTLVADEELLPPESIRFFFLDRAWTDALVQGALSVSTANTIERAQLEALYPQIEEEIDDAERRVRSPGSEALQGGKAGIVTGFLLRSAAVAGWPGMHVRAYKNEPAQDDEEVLPETHASRIKLLRLERLAPSVLLAFFDGVPEVLHLEEPRQGLQFGVRMKERPNGRRQAFVPARNVQTAKYVDEAGDEVVITPEDQVKSPSEKAAKIDVLFRPGAAGVMDMTNTARNFEKANGTAMTGLFDVVSGIPDERIDGAEFAMQMIRFPYRQVFAQSETNADIQDDAFSPTRLKVPELYTQILKQRLGED